MTLPRSSQLRRHADSSLAAASYNPHQLAGIHTGALLALSVLVTVLNFLISDSIESTGGLSGLGLRSMLSTVQAVAQILSQIAVPFIQAGFLCAAIAIAHHRSADPETLLGGFRNFGKVLRYKLLEAGIYLLSALVCVTLANQIFMILPLSDSFYTVMESMLEATEITDAMLDALAAAYMPAIWIFAVLFLGVAVFFRYQYRMGMYLLLSKDNVGAMAALKGSRARMRGRRLYMLRVELGFWWYYLLDAVCSLVLYLDVLLALAGVTLPLSSTAASFLALGLYCLCQLALYSWMRPKVEVTYVHCFDAIIGSSAYPAE